jgi:hypothetical protein
MSQALKKAFDAASRLSEQDQDELAAEERWEAALARSQSALERLAGEASDEHRAGLTQALDPDDL